MITSAIAQASGNASAAALTSPVGSDTELETEDSKSREVDVTEQAKTLTKMLLAMRNTTTTPEELSSVSSPDHSPDTSSSPSEASSYLNGTTNAAVMCHLSDISDVDIIQNMEKEEEKEKDKMSRVEKSDNSKNQSTGKEVVQCEVKKYGAHRLVLAIASPVFEAMFFGAFAEGTPVGGTRFLSAKPDVMELHVTDVTAPVSVDFFL